MYVPLSNLFDICHAQLSERHLILTFNNRQLGREGQEEKDNRYRSYALHEDRPEIVQERIPEGCTKGRERPNREAERSLSEGSLCYGFGGVIWG
jgi:hypothetical protein